MSDRRGLDGKFMVGFLVGGLVGAGVIFLLGTKEGKKVAKDISNKGKKAVDDLHDKIEDLEISGKELLKKSEEIKEHVTEEIEEKKEVLTKEATERIDDTLAHIEAIQERGRQTTASLRKKFKNLPKKG